MADQTKPSTAPENQPADAKLLADRPDLFDRSLAGHVDPPPPAVPPAPPAPTPVSDPPSQDPPPPADPPREELEEQLTLPYVEAGDDGHAPAGEADAGEAIGEAGEGEGLPAEIGREIEAPGGAGTVELEPAEPPRKPGQPRKPGVPKR
jgi:hypothetical protein